MDIKKLKKIIVVEIIICMLLAIFFFFIADIENALYIMLLPFEAIGIGLRWLSLYSTFGNIAAWILYLVLSLVPILFFCFKYFMVRKSKFKSNLQVEQGEKIQKTKSINKYEILKADFLLPIMSIFLFFMIYAFINPYILNKMFPAWAYLDNNMISTIKVLILGIFISLLIGYLILIFINNFENKDPWKRGEQTLIFCALAYAGYISFFTLYDIFSKFAGTIDGINGFVILILDFLMLVPLLYLLIIILSALELIQILKDKAFDGKAVKSANYLARISKETVIASVICNIIGNLIQVVMSPYLSATSYTANIPFLPIILAFASLILAEHLKASSLLYEDNQMII